jgi:hypothetical protein
METRDAFDALLDACLKKEAGEAEWFLRPMKDEKDEMLPGFRSRSKMDPRSLESSEKFGRVGESVTMGAGACCKSFESKKGRDSSNESDFGRGIAPFTVVASNPWATRREIKKSMASFRPPALLRVYPSMTRSSGGGEVGDTGSSPDLGRSAVVSIFASTSY